MATKKEYDVRSVITGALVVTGVSLAVAKSEAKRLDAEASAPNEMGDPTGLERGVITTYEVTSSDGLVIA